MGLQNKSIFTCKKYKKQVIDKNQLKQINKIQVLFCTPGKKGASVVKLLLNNQCTKRYGVTQHKSLLLILSRSRQI